MSFGKGYRLPGFVSSVRRKISRYRVVSRQNELHHDWVAPVDQPLAWVCQLPRSGGTMLIRLFDGHPQIHVKPVVKALVWPEPGTDYLQQVTKNFDLTHLTTTGFVKKASVNAQTTVPIYFDYGWYKEIIDRGKNLLAGKEDGPGYFRHIYNLVCTAHFNAWRNYQNLYGDKKWMVWHYGLSPQVKQSYTEYHELFKGVYPDGVMIFMTRPPLEWVSSIMRLEKETQYRSNFEAALTHYRTIYRDVLALSEDNSNKLMILDFGSLVENPEGSMRTVCGSMGIDWNDTLLQTTTNGIELTPNASVPIESTSSVTRQVLNRDDTFQVPESARDLFAECDELYRSLSATAINKSS